MNDLFWLVNVVIVAIATSAPLANEENVVPAASSAEDMITVGKRAEEMVYFGNQQNEPRVPMKKSQPTVLQTILKPPALEGEVDQGGKMIVHEEIPVEEDLNDRAEAVRGESDIDRLAEGMKVAEEQVEEAAGKNQESEVKNDVNEENLVSDDAQQIDAADEPVTVDLPESGSQGDEVLAGPITDMEQDNDHTNEEDDDDADKELASLSNVASSSADQEDSGSSNDADVEEFLDELQKDSDTRGNEEAEVELMSKDLKNYKVEPENGRVDSNYYQTLYHILANTYRGGPADDYYNYNMMVPSYYVSRRRRSSLGGRNFAIRNRRNGQVRRIKRDLPSDWLAAYRGLDIPYSSDIEDSLLSDPEDSYEDDEPLNEELSRYIYANLLNKIYGDSLRADVEEEIPYEDFLPYELGREIPESLLEEYEPEEILYDPEVSKFYRENPYEGYIASNEYRKRDGAGYYPDSRIKRYFYPAYEEPETHWGAFVPEKRSNYDDAIQRLQRLAFALSDNPRPLYDSLLREYRRK